MQAFSRATLLLGEGAMGRLRRAHVAVFGLGGVGGYAVEALARSGVGHLTLVDGDCFEQSNLNRQLGALHSTLGRPKAAVFEERVADIAPRCRVEARALFLSGETVSEFAFSEFDYVLDAVDDLPAKVLLVQQAKEANTPILSCMGTGNRIGTGDFVVTDIFSTTGCGLARAMRKALRKQGVEGLQVVWAKEPPVLAPRSPDGSRVPGSVSYVPPLAGFLLAGEAIRHLSGVRDG